jgi:hypothetical protein
VTDAVFLLEELRERGVELWRDGGLLHYSAPVGVMTAELITAMRANKTALLEQLRPYPCIGCGKFLFPVPYVLCYWCKKESMR